MVNPLKIALLAVTHPSELRALVTYGVWTDERELEKDETTGYSRAEMKRCWEFLDMTSRSFAAVIKQLDGELCRVICLFYLVLRGLDTVEDDMTIELEEKCQVLETFHEKLSTPGWTYNGNGSREKDRQLLVEFDKVVAEMMRLEEHYREPITRICKHMGHGMAHYARTGAASSSSYAVDSMADYDLYCHYVAGLVGEGLSALFSASGKESPQLGRMLTLSNSMGLMLQKTNITRDFREDLDDGRFFWPRDIWAKYTDDPKQLYEQMDTDPEVKAKAMWALSEMVLDALVHATDCLDYLSLVKNQSIFNFCAIPQVMAIATLEICFMNPKLFNQNVKIRKSLAVLLLQKATNPKTVAGIFLEYGRKIQARASPSDPSYLKICVAIGQIEQWLENRYPSWLFDASGNMVTIPQYRDQPAAKAIPDARIRQLPLSTRGTKLNQLRQQQGEAAQVPDDTKLSGDDWKILFAFVFGMVVFIFAIMGAVIALVFYVSQEEGGFVGFATRFIFAPLQDLMGMASGVASGAGQKVEL